MATYNTPGVYIEEISTLPPSIAPVSTAIPAFIGYTADGDANTPTRITSLIEYVANFGGPYLEQFDIQITDTPTATLPVESRAINSIYNVAADGPHTFNLYQSMQLYFGNGGGPCYVVSAGTYPTATAVTYADIKAAMDSLEKVDEPTLILSPDMVGDSANYGQFIKDVLIQCNKLQDRFGVFDVPDDDISSASITSYRTDMGINNLKYGASYMPFLKTNLTYGIDEATTKIPTVGGYTGVDPTVTAVINKPLDDGTANSVKAINFGLYQQIIAHLNSKWIRTLPPSGAMVGIYAAVDNDRGVWKAPANVSVNLANAPTIAITEEQQGSLNVDPSTGKSINAIRAFTGRGILVWGSRTLAGNDNEWRYVPVRRLFIFAEESIKKASEFVVFEPNDKNTWLRVKSMISNFLTDLWRQGALTGDKPEQAYFVKIGLGETMTAQDILEGKLIIEVGLAAVRPAEFIILKFMHKLQEA